MATDSRNRSNLTNMEEIYDMYDTYEMYQVNNVALIVVYVLIFLVALVGNLIVLLVILTDSRMRKSPANYFLVNLAVADLLVTLICIPMTSVNYVYNVWVLGTTLCKVTGYMQGVCIVASVLTIVLMSIDRYFAIRHPMKNRRIFTVSCVRRLILMTWVSAAVVVLPIALVNKVQSRTVNLGSQSDFCTEMWPIHLLRQIYDVAFLVCMYLVPGGAIVALYTLMGCRLWARDHNLQRQNSIHNHDDVLVARRRLALMMIIISILFAACWLPYNIINICLDFEIDSTPQFIQLYPFALLLGHSNSAQNPILYCFMHKGFKTFVLRVVKCKRKKARVRKQESFTGSLSGNGYLRSTSYKMMGHRTLHSSGVNEFDVITCKNETIPLTGRDSV